MANEQTYDPANENMEIPASFENATEGTVPMVLVDVVPLGFFEQENDKGVKKQVFKINAVFQIEEENSKGYRFTIRRRFSLSLNEKSAFRPIFEALAGRKVTPDEEGGKVKISVRDLGDKFIGRSVLGEIKRSDDGKYDNLGAVMALPKGMNGVTAEGYVRVKDRPATAKAA